LAEFLEDAESRLDEPGFIKTLITRHFMNSVAAKELLGFLKRQKEHTGCALPHRHHLIVEYINAGPGSAPGHQVVLHTLWGGRLNHPFALALAAAWEEKHGERIEVYADNDCISLMLPHGESPETLLSLVSCARLTDLLQKRLEGSGFFGARFRECAGRALLLTRRKINERVPLWMNRLRSQKLLDAVSGFKDFPILLEAWRTCIQDEFDLEHLHQMLTEISTGAIGWSVVRTSRASPMAQGMAWRQINQYMYMGDEQASGKASRLSGNLLKDVIFSPDLRPAVTRSIVNDFELKRQRLAPGYSPATSRDLLDWVKERLLIPWQEWRQLLEAIRRDHGVDPESMLAPVSPKLVQIIPENAGQPLISAVETLPDTIAACYGQSAQIECRPVFQEHPLDHPPLDHPIDASKAQDHEAFVEIDLPDPEQALCIKLWEWLQFYGPVSETKIEKTLGISSAKLGPALESLSHHRKLIKGHLLKKGGANDLCDTENYEILLRLTRIAAAPAVETLPIDQLQLFLAAYQKITQPRSSGEMIYKVLDQLLCCPLKASMWESELLPARMTPYRIEWLDRIIQETDLMWVGDKNQEVLFCFESDLDLLKEEKMAQQPEPGQTNTGSKAESQPHSKLFFDPDGRYHFTTLQRQTDHSVGQLSNLLWEGVWKGIITNDSLQALRQGIANHFKPPRKAAQYISSGGRQRRSGQRRGSIGTFHQWKQAHNLPGNWFLIPQPAPMDDPLEHEERNKARVRLLLDRYGILFRELLQREAPPFRWAALFRSLRIMELSGEVLTGYFFHGIPGLQFISPGALRLLLRSLPQDAVYWFNAADPASMCGIQLDAVRGTLPPRRPSTHLVYRGARRVMASQRHGKDLIFHVPPDEPDIARYLGPLHHLLTRPVAPFRSVTVETVNGQPAANSPYLELLRTAFEVVPDYKSITLYRNRDHLSLSTQ
jgi:ATP-dependent Lhr-like helicase